MLVRGAGTAGRLAGLYNRILTIPTWRHNMRYFLGAAGLAAMLLAAGVANAQQGRQATDDQTSFKQSVRALPSTPKRREIIRSERSTRTNRAHATFGAAPR